MKQKLRSYEFWIAVASAVMAVLQTVSLKIDIPFITEITMAFLSALTVSGILKKNVKADRQSEISDSEKKDAEEGEQDGSRSTA